MEHPRPKPLWIGPVAVDPPVLAAPMAGYTDHAWRQVVRRFGGAGLLVTEMLSARSLRAIAERRGGAKGDSPIFADHGRPSVDGARAVPAKIGTVPLPERLWGVPDEPRPLAVQIWDNDPELLAAVARRLVDDLKISVVDLNFGCPVADVSEKAQSGSYLLRYPDQVGAIVGRVAAACRPVPVTAKIRLGCTRDTINAIDVAQAVEQSGGAAVTVHGRTAADLFRARADWGQIAAIRPHLQRIPLVGNGDLRTPQEVVDAFARYGVDGVMIGRAALGRPWLFAQVRSALEGRPVPPEPDAAEQAEAVLLHCRLLVERFGPRDGTIMMRRQACCYARARPGVREFRAAVSRAQTPEQVHDVVGRLFRAEAP